MVIISTTIKDLKLNGKPLPMVGLKSILMEQPKEIQVLQAVELFSERTEAFAKV